MPGAGERRARSRAGRHPAANSCQVSGTPLSKWMPHPPGPGSRAGAVVRQRGPHARHRLVRGHNTARRKAGRCPMLVLLLDDCPVPVDVRSRDRLLARIRAFRLDAALAAGASPDATVALALRARLLVRMPVRRDLARTARRILAAATACRSRSAGTGSGTARRSSRTSSATCSRPARFPPGASPRPGPCSRTAPAPSTIGPAVTTCAPGFSPRPKR
jgi:hypothetical protein